MMGRRDAGLRVVRPRYLVQFAGLCAANAASVVSLYWNQAMVRLIGADLPGAPLLLSLVSVATLAGYAVGVGAIAFVPPSAASLSIRNHLYVLSAALLAAALAPGLPALVVASFFVGCGASVAQRLLAAGARLAGPSAAGTGVGVVLSAALIGVLGVRLAGDTIGGAIGWRPVFMLAAAAVAAAAVFNLAVRTSLDAERCARAERPRLLAVWRSAPLFRWAALQQGFLFAAYSAGWMVALTEVPARERALIVVAGGGAGLFAALAGGKLVDRFQTWDIPRFGAAAIVGATGLLLPLAYHATPGTARVLLSMPGMALLDAGFQIVLVANQTRVQALLPAARTRLGATLTVCGSVGAGIGAGAAYWLWHSHGWPAAIEFAAIVGVLGLACSLLRAVADRRARPDVASGGHMKFMPITDGNVRVRQETFGRDPNEMPSQGRPALHAAVFAGIPTRGEAR